MSESEAELHRRVGLVRELADDPLRLRYNLKISSKASSFSSIDWDVKTKTFDARLGGVSMPYATVKIRWQREFNYEIETYFQRDLFESAQINMTADEVGYLIREFQRIKAHIESERNRLS